MRSGEMVREASRGSLYCALEPLGSRGISPGEDGREANGTGSSGRLSGIERGLLQVESPRTPFNPPVVVRAY